MKEALVIIPCGKELIWEEEDYKYFTSVPAFAAYRDEIFQLGVFFANEIRADFVILTKGIGLLDGNNLINKETVIAKQNLRKLHLSDRICCQLENINVYQYKEIICLGNVPYRNPVNDAFERMKLKIFKPYQGLTKNEYLKRLRSSVEDAIVTTIADEYYFLDYDSYKVDKFGKMSFLKNCWPSPMLKSGATYQLEGPPPTNIEIELERFRSEETRIIFHDMPLNHGACDQMTEIARNYLGKKLLFNLWGKWDSNPYPFEAQLKRIKLDKNTEGFYQCHMCLTDIENQKSHSRSKSEFYDSISSLPEDPYGALLLDLSRVKEISVIK